MNRQKRIEEFKEGDFFSGVLAVKSCHKGTTKAGKPYLRLILMDKSGEVVCPVWENAEAVGTFCEAGGFLFCSGKIGLYNGQKQLQQGELAAANQEDVDIGNFLQETSRDRQQMADELLQIVESIENSHLKDLLQIFFGSGEFWKQFQQAAAAKGAHHAYAGGLLEHTLSCTQVAGGLASHYPGVNRSLLLAGTLLHDIGKVKEMEFCGVAVEYTTPGRLKGHLVIGSEMIAAAAATIQDFPQELLVQLQHLVLSHHGRLDFGSPVVPMTLEAFLINMVDEMDARMNMIEQLRHKMDAGHYSFTEYQRLLERYLYLAGYAAEEEHPENEGGGETSAFMRNQLSLWK